MDLEKLEKAAGLLRESSQTTALTGAGVSVESGLPDFRSVDGLWTKYDPAVYAHIDGFRRHPQKIWTFVGELLHASAPAVPNDGHRALAELEAAGRLHCLVTQNIDGLHQAAGSRKVIEFHGNLYGLVCLGCGRRDSVRRPDGGWLPLPPQCLCGRIFKPDFVFFGEGIPPDALREAFTAARTCRAMIVAGTSAEVAPASFLPEEAKNAGARIVEINLAPTTLTRRITDVFLQGRFAEIMPALVQAVAKA